MGNDIKLLNRLLYEKSSNVLIFRSHEYKLDVALALEKGQILKDIVSAANAWRRADTYILIGVEEDKGGKNKVLGVIEHLDEKKIIDFVNSKVQKPIIFSYKALTVDRKKIGMIHIPLQERPFFLKEDYANLKKYVIYIRRGDSVQEAETDEVVKIKEYNQDNEKAVPSFKVEFAHSSKKKPLGDHLKLKTFLIGIPDLKSLPDFSVTDTDHMLREFYYCFPIQKINKNYYRELAEHYQKIGSMSLIDFCVINTGTDMARDVRIEINVEDPKKEYFCLEEFELPHRPEKIIGLSNTKPLMVNINANIQVKWKSPFWIIKFFFKEVPSQKTVFTSGGIYLGGKTSMRLDMVVLLKARNLPQPIHFPLIIDIQTQKRKLEKDIICKSI